MVACRYWLHEKSNAVICSCPRNNNNNNNPFSAFSFPPTNWQMETAEVSSARCKVKAMSGWQRWDFENTGVAVLARKSALAKALFKSLTWQNKYSISSRAIHSNQHYETYSPFSSDIINIQPKFTLFFSKKKKKAILLCEVTRDKGTTSWNTYCSNIPGSNPKVGNDLNRWMWQTQ